MKMVLQTKKHLEYINGIHKYSNIINNKNKKGWTALILACMNNTICSNIETIRELIKNGADLDLQNDFSETALMIAVLHVQSGNNIEVVKELIKNGAQLNKQNPILFIIKN